MNVRYRAAQSLMAVALVTQLVLGVAVLWLPQKAAAALPQFYVLADSTPADNSAKWMSMVDLRSLANNANPALSEVTWPQRMDGARFVCDSQTVRHSPQDLYVPGSRTVAPASEPYKTLPQVASSSGSGPRAGNNWGASPSDPSGLQAENYGDCGQAVVDGGWAKGTWLKPTAFQWAVDSAAPISIGPPPVVVGGSTTTTVGSAKLNACRDGSLNKGITAPTVWAHSYRDDTVSLAKDLFDANGYTGFGTGGGQAGGSLYSNGMTVLRNDFDIPQNIYDAIASGSYELHLQAIADDFYQIYINGVNIVTANYTSTANDINLGSSATFKNLLRPGHNVISMTGIDKLSWLNGPGYVGRGAGMCYTFDLINPLAPAAGIVCGAVTSNPLPLNPSSGFIVKVSVLNAANNTPGSTFLITVKRPNGMILSSGTYPAVWANQIYSGQTTTIPPPSDTGNYTVTWTLTVPGSPPTKLDCSGVLTSADLPYLSVYAGDVMAGSSPSIDSSGGKECYTNSSAGFNTWNNGGPDFTGAGTQMAAFALDAINFFATGQRLGSTSPTDLAFANTSTAVATGKYGGEAGMTVGQCDYTSSIGSNGEIVDERTGDYSLGGLNLGNSARRTIHVTNGNFYLSGDVQYANTRWADARQIPDFRVVVEGGDIYIDNNVSSLSGTYVAIPKNGIGGHIYTCTNGQGQYVQTSPSYYTDCDKQLVVYGSFVARKVYFQRTYGSVEQAAAGQTYTDSKAAEVFVYTPEVWIPRTASNDPLAIDSITGLAPVL